MTGEERQILLTKLTASRKLLLAAVHGMNDAQWAFKPDVGSYSIAQCVEHLVITEAGVLSRLNEKVRTEVPAPERWAEAAGKDDLIWRVMPQRKHKVKAPPEMQPKGELATPQAGVENFERVRAETIVYVESTRDDVRSYFLPHVAMGTLDGWQWLLTMALHAERHAAQIEEIKAHPQFP
jgi:hypothetical protein